MKNEKILEYPCLEKKKIEMTLLRKVLLSRKIEATITDKNYIYEIEPHLRNIIVIKKN